MRKKVSKMRLDPNLHLKISSLMLNISKHLLPKCNELNGRKFRINYGQQVLETGMMYYMHCDEYFNGMCFIGIMHVHPFNRDYNQFHCFGALIE